jgi:translocation and assembly module TamA
MTRYFLKVCLALLLAQPAAALAAALEYSVTGLQQRLQQNALAWLGAPPETPQERLNFLVTAQQRVENSLKALGYYHADVTLEVARTEPVWSLQVIVDPGEPVLIREVSIRLQGAAAQDEEFVALVSAAPLTPGNVFSHGDYEGFKNRLMSLGQQRGYFDARLVQNQVRVNAAAYAADIDLLYDSGMRYRFGAVSYDDEQISPELLAALQPFDEGDFFDQARLQFFQSQLRSTRYFSGVLLRPELEQARDHKVPLSLQLYPARRHGFDVGVGYSTDTEERVSFIWRTPRINRRGDSQETRLAYSAVNPSGSFTYTIPLSHPLNDLLHLSVGVENNEFGDLDSRQKHLGVRREVRTGKWVYSYSLRGLDESWELKNIKENGTYTLPGFSLSRRDHWGPLVDPTHGFSQLYVIEAASADLGSSEDLLRATADFRYIYTPIPRHRLVGRAELGGAFIADTNPRDLAPSLNFFAGGSQSIRGYGYQSVGAEVVVTNDQGEQQTLVVGGNRLLTASVEYQYYFTDTWRGAAFVDAGDAFDEDDFDLKVGPGVGIHYLSPVGAIRLEVANSASDDDPSWRIHLNIGAEF